MKTLLFVNACLRGPKDSRTHRISAALLTALRQADPSFSVQEADLASLSLAPLTGDDLLWRDSLTPAEKETDPRCAEARRFAGADLIVIGAPYWDLSFPAALKTYLEHVCINGVAFRYAEDGTPVGLCRAKQMVYVTTSGGFLEGANFGYDYLCGLNRMFGITTTHLLACEGLDIWGCDVEAAMKASLERIPALCESLLRG